MDDFDFSRWDQPEPDPNFRRFLEEWLGFQRHEFVRKMRDLTPSGLVAWSIPPVELSVLGLVRHMTEMEHNFLTWGLGGGERETIYGDDDYAGGSIETIEVDLQRYRTEVEKADLAVSAMSGLDSKGLGHDRPLGATLVKMINEYALHAGQAHMLRYAALGKIVR
jgi:hypothetical protein